VRPRGQAPAVQVPAPVPPPAAVPLPVSVPPPAAVSSPAPSPAPVALPEQPENAVLLPPEPLPDDGIPRVLQVRVEQAAGRFRVFIEGTMPLEYAVRELLEPDRLVIDLAGAVFVPVKQEIPVAGPVVAEVRAAQFQVDPNVTRVVVEFRRKTAYTVTSASADGSVLVVEILEPSLRAHVVAIDAGHGGRDPGAIGPTGLHEKEVVLDVALRVRELLVRSGVRVIMTRETDTFVELADRSRLARAQGATAFVSIHANASTRPAANGSETYYLTPQSLVLAQMMQEELGRVSGLANRGVRTANFQVLRENDVPAVLVEVAYLSNVDEEARLRAAAFRQRLAEAVARAVHRFLLIYPVPAS
jgi:N-acetylmuramoyl-L-alanine amidase